MTMMLTRGRAKRLRITLDDDGRRVRDTAGPTLPWPVVAAPPPDGDGGPPVTLRVPEEVYRDFVRPCIPPRDRPVLSRRCSTRFPPVNRMCADDALDATEGGRFGVEGLAGAGDGEEDDGNKRFIAVVGGVATTAIGGGGNDGPNRRNIRRGWWTPSVRGTPGVSNTRSADPDRFELDTRSWTTDRALARRRYAEATAAWDRHLAAIPSPPLRLVNCLLQREPAFVHPSPGGGQRRATMASTVDAIVAHHRAVDERCLNGEIPASSGAFPPDLPVVPPTPLSFFVSQWIVGLVRDTLRGVRTPDTVSAERIVGCLMENGADPSIFAVPVNELSGFRDDAFVAFNLLGHLRGASLLEHVRSFAKVATSWNRGNTEEGLSQRVVFRIGREVCKVYNTLAAAIDGHVLAKAGLPREVVISDEGRG